MGCKFQSSLPLPSTWLKERVGLGQIQGPFHTRDPLRSHLGGRQMNQTTLPRLLAKNKNKPHPNPPQVVVFLASALHFQGLPSSLLSFVKSISKGGKKKSENGTKQNVTTLTWGAQQLALSPGGPGCSRAGQPLYTGSAFAPRSREGERSLPLSRVEAPRPDV